MRLLLLLVVGLVIYGSLYPFGFSGETPTPSEWSALFTVAPLTMGRGDILANILLFVPVGFLGVRAAEPANAVVRMLAVLVLGLALAILLQFLQLDLPGRFPSLGDAAWNGAGLACGVAVALLPTRRTLPFGLEPKALLSAPVLLICLWVAYRLVPFVPSLDLQQIKDSLKPAFREPIPAMQDLLRDTVAWMVVIRLWASVDGRKFVEALAVPLIAGVLAAEILIVRNWLSSADIAGAAAAVLIWWLVVRRLRHRDKVLALLMLAAIVIDALSPFRLRDAPVEFRLIPFAGYFDGDVATSLGVLFRKCFAYGVLLWLLARAGAAWIPATLVTAATLALLEAAQTRLVAHTPEITDPLLAVFLAFVLKALDNENSRFSCGRADRQQAAKPVAHSGRPEKKS